MKLTNDIHLAGFSQNFWTKLHSLDKKRQDIALTELELKELTDMTDIMEAANVERIKALIELANNEQTDLDTLMIKLGLKNENRKEDTNSNQIRMTLINAYNSGQRLFEDWDFEQANLDNLDLSGCTFKAFLGCNMRNCNLENTQFIQCNLKCTDMTGSNLKNARIEGCSVEHLSLYNTNTEGIVFKNNSFHSNWKVGMDYLEYFKTNKYE